MNGIKKNLQWVLVISCICAFTCGCTKTKNEDLIKVLILSGRNNHEWQKTSPLLAKIFKDAGLFSVNITDMPDTLTYKELKRYDVVLSNWNTWPDNTQRLSEKWEKDFLKYVREGGGTLFIHAGASSFYDWDEYHRIGIGRWGKETKHGEQTKGKITGFDHNHPITNGLKDFFIIDEIWEKTEICPGAQSLASVTATDEKDGHMINENAVFVNQTGKGRSFYTALGHDERALLNSGLQTLIIRGTLWAAKAVKLPEIPLQLSNEETEKSFSHGKSDTTVTLKRGFNILWQFNYNNRYGRPYFHPLNTSNSTITCVDPPDHPWHLGLWFCWKYINDINYWEYLDEFKTVETGYMSAGITEIRKITISQNDDFSAAIVIDIAYHPIDSQDVLIEKSQINISAPADEGSYYIDYDNTYTAINEYVTLDRTPVTTEPGGRTWGGYAGLSVRFSQDFTSPFIIAPSDSADYKKNSWVYMGFNTITGDTTGICIMQDPQFTTPTTSWYIIRNQDIPFYYYSPAVLYDGKIVLKRGEKLHLKYRVWIIPGKTSKEELDLKYNNYLNRI